jgi:hypothetical protein
MFATYINVDTKAIVAMNFLFSSILSSQYIGKNKIAEECIEKPITLYNKNLMKLRSSICLIDNKNNKMAFMLRIMFISIKMP